MAVHLHALFADGLARANEYSGQLALYARVVRAALGDDAITTWIHLPVLGIVVEVKT